MTQHRPDRVRSSGSAPSAALPRMAGAVAAAAIPAIALAGLGTAAPAAAAPASLPAAGLAPKLPTQANVAAAQQRIAAHLVASAIPAHVTVASAPRTATVRAGDTVSHIAARHGVSVRQVLRANGLSASDTIHPGQKLKLSGSTAARSTGTARAASAPASSRTVTVRAGDTLSGIAARHGVGLSTLLKANGLSSASTIHPGQRIKLGGASVSSTSSSRPQLVPNSFLHYRYPDDTVRSANENKYELLSRNLPGRSEMQSIIASTARSMGVDPALALAHAYQESGFNQAAVSPANAIGAMQVIPSSGEWASQLVGRKLNLLDPYDNATAGVAIIRALHGTSHTVDGAIASYYQGQGSVRRNGMYPDTRRYVASVKAHMARFA